MSDQPESQQPQREEASPPRDEHLNGIWPDEAITRPPVEVLSDDSPEVQQPGSGEAEPVRFTHKLIRDEPYRASGAASQARTVHAGTRVELVNVQSNQGWVVDGAGNRFVLPISSLRPLSDANCQ